VIGRARGLDGKVDMKPHESQGRKCRRHVGNPPALSTIGECDQESILLPEDIYRRAVEFSRLSTDVLNDSKTR
jgi:hypothetical protein